MTMLIVYVLGGLLVAALILAGLAMGAAVYMLPPDKLTDDERRELEQEIGRW